jgi:uncharacterized protein (TIGR03437 family)
MRSYERSSTSLFLSVFFVLMTSALVSQGVMLAQGTINTYAGSDALFAGGGQPATSAQLVNPDNMAFDAQDNLYFSDSGLSMVLKVSAATGVISVVAGNGLSSGGGDGGLAVGASLGNPQGLAFDSSGNLYIADEANNNVRKVDTNGIITTVAGGGGASGLGDGGLATQAGLSWPTGVAIDKAGDLYIAEYANNRIRMVAAGTGIISTIAGTGPTGYSGDGGPATKATFTYPTGVAVDSSGNVYVADSDNCVIRKISPSGIISTVAGNGPTFGYGGDNGPATKAQLGSIGGVAIDASGNLYIADTGNERIRYVSASGIITTIAGTGAIGFSGDGSPATGATLDDPAAVAVDSSGAVYVADMANNRIRRFVSGGNIATFAGTAVSAGDGGASTQARLDNPMSVAVDSSGNLYIADPSANRIRKVAPSGTITTLAGNGEAAYGGDHGPGPEAALNYPDAVAVDSAGNVYIADARNERIRRVDASTGIITTFAGNGSCCYAGAGTGGDGGPATAATLELTTSVAVDGAGNVYLVDMVSNNHINAPRAIRRVTTDGKINVWAGGATTTIGYSGDGGSPLQAEFGYSISIAAGSDGTLYIADTSNNRIRKIDPAGSTISLLAGNGQYGDSGNGGPALSASVTGPTSVALDAAGNLYIGETGVVRQITPSGVIGPYAGNDRASFSGDGGPALSASITGVDGLAVDSGNNLYLADNGNRRIRQVQPAASPAIALSSTSVTFTLTATSSTATTQTFVVTNTGQGTLHWAASASTTSGGEWLSVSPATGAILAGQPGTTVTVTANPSGLAAGDYYGQIQVTSPNATSQIQLLTVRLTVATAGEAPPVVFAGGVVNAASYTAPVAPGTFVSIFGAGFTDSTSAIVASAFPWLDALGGTSVTIGGEPLPLYFVTAGQINAILPFDLAVDTSLQVVVTRNGAVSAPQPVNLVSSQPGVFTQAQTGQGIGAILIVHPDGSWVVAGNGNSAKAGDTLEIFCTGLGDVSPRLVAGYPAPPSPLSYVIDAVTLTIGGVNVVPFFSGAAPGFSGLYQVNATIPAGIAASQQSPLVLSQGGRAGATVTVPIE